MPADSDVQTTNRIPGHRGASVLISHSSHDGAVSALVALDGAVVDLRITESAALRPPGQLAHDILGCVRAAQEVFRGISASEG
ncbi:hypothetical protein [Amycolatopsis sp. FDAARGOS 1241]|uniref:hypothetical protein n=1 Tax=Amycolatopsis sp. FDAARGOS 1241 TaxID=2778070 RepID=UPI001952227C|nr:hypothetical protein [Amycolatopsis sp. FDAARGOS 1241]QRP47856.1 hypothetical protein I6J71_08055 [Amycolatopsis sp. FDAARGOS 1241]